jgi:hypothetical protein
MKLPETAVIAAWLAFSAPAAAAAQEAINHGTVSGRVTDASGAVVEGAEVVGRHTATNVATTVTTDAAGRFRFADLRIGPYEFTIRARGFAPAPRALTVTAGSSLDLPVPLRVGAIEASVTVTAETTILETARSQITATIAEAEVIREALTGARGRQSLAIDADSVVHAAWLDGRDAKPGAALSLPTPAPAATAGPTTAASGHAMHRSSRQDIYHAVWRPDGQALEARVATDVCFGCKTSVATAPDRTTYVAFRHIYPTNLRDMAVARSIDGGRTFAAPVRVSEDHWQINACPEDGPSIAVAAGGTLHIAWPTLIPGTEPQGQGSRSAATAGECVRRSRLFPARLLLPGRRRPPRLQ